MEEIGTQHYASVEFDPTYTTSEVHVPHGRTILQASGRSNEAENSSADTRRYIRTLRAGENASLSTHLPAEIYYDSARNIMAQWEGPPVPQSAGRRRLKR